ncbi:MAG: hypothetical protein NWS31_05430 [Crocinitomicaceae bacterium]|jgi:hypothetical protein|nr:hypothetical protein [Crocinitomicaceae bacterium]MDP4806542.1 hypothetical protein [Crocinitomicaceae bacterium]
MRKYLLYLILLTGLFGCNFPTELSVSGSTKPADKFSRTFIDKIISGQTESAFADIDPDVLNDKAKEFITNASRNINGATPKKYRVVETNWTSGVFTKTGKFTNYRLGYEYEFEQGNILFNTVINEKDGKLLVTSFNGEFLPAPLSELTKFTLTGKSVLHYIFLVFCILVPLFILITLIVMLFSKMTVKKKVIWALIILLVSLPKFIINWGNGQLDFSLLNISLLGSGFSKPTLYSAWLLSFHIPFGAIVYWFKRKSLLPEIVKDDSERVDNDNIIGNDTTKNEE